MYMNISYIKCKLIKNREWGINDREGERGGGGYMCCCSLCEPLRQQ